MSRWAPLQLTRSIFNEVWTGAAAEAALHGATLCHVCGRWSHLRHSQVAIDGSYVLSRLCPDCLRSPRVHADKSRESWYYPPAQLLADYEAEHGVKNNGET